MIKFILSSVACLMILYHSATYAQEESFISHDIVFHNDTIILKAKFCDPNRVKKPPVLLLIAGSGPTDMDGNNFMMKNDHLKLLAESLAKEGIATLRYNKRTIPDKGDMADHRLITEGAKTDYHNTCN